jgi:hypothetical protein
MRISINKERKPINAYFVLSALALLALVSGRAHAQGAMQGVTKGTFTDATGSKHNWSVQENHVLNWDEKPYIPVGVTFVAQSLSTRPTDDDLQKDKETLQRLRKQGITDLCLKPTIGISRVNPEIFQKLIDFLDAEGFSYGLALNDAPREPLLGYYVHPSSFLQDIPPGAERMTYPARGVLSSLYFSQLSSSGEILDRGEVAIRNDSLIASLTEMTTILDKRLFFLIPERVYMPTENPGIPNLWEGFEAYRDTLLTFFSRVKLGKGFRFFLDPLTPRLGLTEEMKQVIPSSSTFSKAWVNWLASKYRTVEDVHVAWKMPERNFHTFSEIADVLPLWSPNGKGAYMLYQRKTGQLFRVSLISNDTKSSNYTPFWSDYHAFLAETTRDYMNDIAIALKRGVADVPVVYRAQETSDLFQVGRENRAVVRANAQGLQDRWDFDGVILETSTQLAAGYLYAQANDAPRPLWLGALSPERSSPPTTQFPRMEEIGARAFFTATTDEEQTSLAAQYLSHSKGNTRLQKPPQVIPYPVNERSLTPQRLTNGDWWLPSRRSAVLYDFASAGHAYAFKENDEVVYYFWNPYETRDIHIPVPKQADLKNAKPLIASDAAHMTRKKDTLTLTIGPEPIRLLNYPGLPIPHEAFSESFDEAWRLYETVERGDYGPAARTNAGRLGSYLRNLQRGEKQDDSKLTMLLIKDLYNTLDGLRKTARNYAWREAEELPNRFDQIIELPGAGNNQVLQVGARDTTLTPATVNFRLTINKERVYHLWYAASPNAPLSIWIDKVRAEVGPGDVSVMGDPYAGGKLVWHHVALALKKGEQELSLHAEGPLLIDIVCITPDEINPKGPVPPSVLPALKTKAKNNKN